MRLFNNTTFSQYYVNLVIAYVKYITDGHIECITIEENIVIVYGIDCILKELSYYEIDRFYFKNNSKVS